MTRLKEPGSESAAIGLFRTALEASGFQGDLEDSTGAREVASTDNSIYQVRPLAIAYPKTGDDVNRIVAATRAVSPPLALGARGGGTGTNGQSLSSGVIVDFARHMTAILSIEVGDDGGLATVEPGVVLDQLNAALEPYGLFFPPMVSTASRATIGGMVATDASGKGSRRYGKTSDYIEALDIVLADGEDWSARTMTTTEAETLATRADRIGTIHRECLRISARHADEIARVFPTMNRGLTGYNLQKMHDARTGVFSLPYLLSGSEGTLALTKSITVRVIRRPPARALAVIRYDDFQGGLGHVERLLATDPVAVEIVDDKVMEVAQTDILWTKISAVLGDRTGSPVRAMNFIEFAGRPDEVERGLEALQSVMARPDPAVIDWRIVRSPEVIADLWRLREKSVGLLARLGGGRQGIPFVEDTAVPPSRLADYVADFRALLDCHGLTYGMFGHADVGCLHVRPFLDLKDPAQAALIRPVSDGVAALAKSYGGLLWGEHGRGFRGEYSPFFFGPALFPELGRLKRAFDPDNLLNPGKLAAPSADASLDRIDAVAFRGAFDRQVLPDLLRDFDRAVACNGNGACFSWDALEPLCPSYKATRDRAQSPKGRAALLRGWARLEAGADTPERREMETAVAASLSTCLSCKACTTLCPVKVDIPTMKSRFLDRYYRRRRRPLRHLLAARMEGLLALGRQTPALANLMLGTPVAVRLIARLAGYVDLPAFAPPRRRSPAARATVDRVVTSIQAGLRTIVLVEDTFTSSFDGPVVDAAADVLTTLGFAVFHLPPRANGKALHLLGLRDAFAPIAKRRVAALQGFQAAGAVLVGLDAATSLMFEQEYSEFAPSPVRVVGLETVLEERSLEPGALAGPARPPYRLFSHCTEQALRPEAAMAWVRAFSNLGLTLDPVRSGCCGMAGMFGHETDHLALSRRLYDLSWRDALETSPAPVLATGFSCRCQAKRLSGLRPQHPVEALSDALKARAQGPETRDRSIPFVGLAAVPPSSELI